MKQIEKTVQCCKLNQLLLFVLAATALSFSLAAFPVRASALEVSTHISTQTAQVVPPGGSACGPISATTFTPYIYDEALHSFEFTVPDASYVGLLGSVGNTSIPFRLITRRVDPSGAVRIHVDIATTPVRGTLPLQVTLLSARTGQPVCMSLVSMSVVGSGPAVQSKPVAVTQPALTTVESAPTSPSSSPTSAVTVPSTSSSGTAPWTTSTQRGTTSATSSSVVSTMQNALQNLCASDAGAYRLWLILLVLFTLIVGAALWAEFPMSMPCARTPERVAMIILGLLLLLLGFWYFSVSCRAALWMPLLAFLIAVLGLLAAFWNHPRVTQLLLIQDPKI